MRIKAIFCSIEHIHETMSGKYTMPRDKDFMYVNVYIYMYMALVTYSTSFQVIFFRV